MKKKYISPEIRCEDLVREDILVTSSQLSEINVNDAGNIHGSGLEELP